ncbi:ATP-binding protein [Salinibaculum rarum]|uniref:ATP-binding protein n=1 Tax=Salinibaculum rarum TaxID=3058903 RepID=UPI00265D7B76|nr:ATP-binding protein [Salinibaculum sp. KK48]
MYVSKRVLGEGYIVATGAVLGAVLAVRLLLEGGAGLFWVLASGVSVAILVGADYWLKRLDLGSDQVWQVSNWSALGLGIGTATLVVLTVATPATTVRGIDVTVLGATLGAAAVIGALTGVIVTVHQTNQNLQRQNAVLHRIMRHNLRNDMSVVLCLLDDIQADGNDETSETARQAREKIQSFVKLTDRVRQANVGLSDTADKRKRRDVAAIVASRVKQLRRENPDLTVEMELCGQAFASVGETFGLVIDNLVESALSEETPTPHLTVRVECERETVRLVIDDTRQTIPAADLSAVASGSETALKHGLGVELWLVEWLVNANEGKVTYETNDDGHRVTIKLDRVRARFAR